MLTGVNRLLDFSENKRVFFVPKEQSVLHKITGCYWEFDSR